MVVRRVLFVSGGPLHAYGVDNKLIGGLFFTERGKVYLYTVIFVYLYLTFSSLDGAVVVFGAVKAYIKGRLIPAQAYRCRLITGIEGEMRIRQIGDKGTVLPYFRLWEVC